MQTPIEPQDSKHPSSLRRTTREARRSIRRRRVQRRILRWTVGVVGSFVLLLGIAAAVGFGTPFGSRARMVVAETIVSTRHFYLAKYITTPAEYADLLNALNAPIVNTGVTHHTTKPGINNTTGVTPAALPPVQVLAISGSGWNGYVTLVHDPKQLRLVHANVQGAMGEYITNMAKRVGATVGINASGFEDPNGNGWGGKAVGLEFIGGNVISNSAGAGAWPVVGFTSQGDMVMGNYTVAQLQHMGVRDAMQFHPQLVVNGKPQITSGDGGWGYDPRTAIGQAKDGTVILIVINGRFHGGSGLGASQRQVMNLMLKYGAVNACAMDGGSSSVLYANGQIMNAPSTIDPNGQRHLPDAWAVFPSISAASAYTP